MRQSHLAINGFKSLIIIGVMCFIFNSCETVFLFGEVNGQSKLVVVNDCGLVQVSTYETGNSLCLAFDCSGLYQIDPDGILLIKPNNLTITNKVWTSNEDPYSKEYIGKQEKFVLENDFVVIAIDSPFFFLNRKPVIVDISNFIKSGERSIFPKPIQLTFMKSTHHNEN